MIESMREAPEVLEKNTTFHGDEQVILRCYDDDGTYAFAAVDCYHNTMVCQLHLTPLRWDHKVLRNLRKDLGQVIEDRTAEGYKRYFALKAGVDIKWAKFVMSLGFPVPEVHMTTAILIGEEDGKLSTDDVLTAGVQGETGPESGEAEPDES